jgi:hypothetical protein
MGIKYLKNMLNGVYYYRRKRRTRAIREHPYITLAKGLGELGVRKWPFLLMISTVFMMIRWEFWGRKRLKYADVI